MAAQPEKKEPKGPFKVTNNDESDIFEPVALCWIKCGQTVEFDAISPWLQYQIDNSNGKVVVS